MDPLDAHLLRMFGVAAAFIAVAAVLMPKADELGGRVSDWMEDRKDRRRAAEAERR